MADVITRFKLETTQYDSKLRDSVKSMKEVIHQAELGGKTFNGFDRKTLEAARALGTLETGAMNSKDKVKELVGAFNDMAKTYNVMSNTVRESDVGKALAESLSKLSDRIKDAKDELYGLSEATKGKGGLFGDILSSDKLNGMLQVFGGNLMTKAAGAVAQLGSEMADAVKEGIDLARQGEGVRLAFERLNKPGLLNQLKEATHGTVTNLELMKAAVKFNDFNLPLKELGTMLAFAQKKAKDTGQSVDYMVDSIVTGLGRKSLMILDNLGLSASEVKDKMKETGDMTTAVGAIIRDQMSKAGDYVETAADRAARATADAQDKMEEFGRAAIPVAEEWAEAWNTIKMGGLEVLNNVVGPLIRSWANMQKILRQGGLIDWDKVNENTGGGSRRTPGIDHTVYSSGGYVEVVDPKTGKLIGGKHFDSLSDDAIDEWKKTLVKTSRKGGGNSSQKTEEQLNTEAIQKLTQEYVKATEERRTAIREEIKTLQERNDIIQTMKNEALGKYKPIEPMGEAEGIMPGGFYSTPTSSMQKAQLSIKTPLQALEEELKNLTAFRDASMTSGDWQNRNFLVQAKQQEISGYKGETQKKEEDEMKKLTNKMSSLTSGISSITGGLQSMGVELPKGLQETISVINGLMAIVQGVSTVISIFSTGAETANTVATTANTIALGAMTTALYANTAVSAIPFFRGGGIAHAARGFVPGNDHNDNIPVMVSSGELILNRAQQGNLASQLEGGGLNGMQLHAVITGEQLRLVLNNNSRRTGRGEYVTTNFNRS